MSTQTSSRVLLVAIAIAAGMAGGCTPDYVQGNKSPILFRIADINGGAPLDSDVLSGDATQGFFVVEDEVPVTLAVRSKNQNFDNVPQIPMAVFVERYDVRYYRSDGRNTEGVDVPYRISGNVTTAVDAGTGSDANVTIPVEIVRRQAKLEPPLRNLVGGGGEIVITCFAEITIHGHTVAGEAVESTGRVQVDFADLVE